MVRTYYGIMGFVLARSIDRRDASAIGWTVTVIAGNEAWNRLLFARRSPRAAFFGVLAFMSPAGLQRSVWRDECSRYALLPYTSYVITYDVVWAYRLWRLNPSQDR